MFPHDPTVENALVILTDQLLSNQKQHHREAEGILRQFLAEPHPQKGSQRFLNHKTIWPEHVRPIERYLSNPGLFFITKKETAALQRLQKILRPSP